MRMQYFVRLAFPYRYCDLYRYPFPLHYPVLFIFTCYLKRYPFSFHYFPPLPLPTPLPLFPTFTVTHCLTVTPTFTCSVTVTRSVAVTPTFTVIRSITNTITFFPDPYIYHFHCNPLLFPLPCGLVFPPPPFILLLVLFQQNSNAKK